MSRISWVMRSMCSTVMARVDTALKAVAGIGGEVEAARTTRNGLGPPEGGFDVDVLRVVRHGGGIAAHDAGQRLDLHVVGNHADLGVHRDGVAVEQLELSRPACPSARPGRRGSCRGRKCARDGPARTSRSWRCPPARVTLRWPQRARRSTIHGGVAAWVLTLRTMRPEKRPHRSGALILTGSLSACPRLPPEKLGAFSGAPVRADTSRATP